MIESRVGSGANFNLNIKYSYDGEKQLGTGGALKQALKHCASESVLVVNGDTFVELNINVLFDCSGSPRTGEAIFKKSNFLNSGSRSNIPFKKSPNIFKLNKYLFKEDNQEVKLNKKTNYYEHYENGELITKPTLKLQLFDKENKEILVGNVFGYPTDQEDIDLIEKYKNMCFSLDDYIKISLKFKKEQLRYLLPKIFIVNGISILLSIFEILPLLSFIFIKFNNHMISL
jgi:hypothetical protein